MERLRREQMKAVGEGCGRRLCKKKGCEGRASYEGSRRKLEESCQRRAVREERSIKHH